jgi:hypothetical protein
MRRHAHLSACTNTKKDISLLLREANALDYQPLRDVPATSTRQAAPALAAEQVKELVLSKEPSRTILMKVGGNLKGGYRDDTADHLVRVRTGKNLSEVSFERLLSLCQAAEPSGSLDCGARLPWNDDDEVNVAALAKLRTVPVD